MKKHCKRHNSGSATQKLNDLGSHSSFEDIVQTNLGITDFPGVTFFSCFSKTLDECLPLYLGDPRKFSMGVSIHCKYIYIPYFRE